jgi:F-type H+-transporting ATPase subunit delta
MTKLSRRAIAAYAADQLLNARPAKSVAKELAALLAESGRKEEVDFLLEDIAWILEERQALVSAKVTSAKPLSAVLESEIKKMLKSQTGSKQIAVENNIDKSVIGGARIDTATKVWDYTVARQLSELKEAF